MKKLLMGLLIFAFAINLTACGNLKNSNLTNNPANTNGKQKTYQTTVTDKNGYNVLLKDGQYLISPTNGITASNNDNNVDNRSLEVGLLNISHDLFSTDKYVFQGKLIFGCLDIASTISKGLIIRKVRNTVRLF